jgi:tight adherence protein B
MMAAIRVVIVAAVAAAWVGVATAADSLRVVEAGGSTYPDHAYILTLPSPQPLQRTQVDVTENGGPVSNLRLTKQGTATSSSEVILAIDASESMSGRPYADALAAARAFVRRMNPEQRVAIVTFNDKVHVLQGFTTDKGKLLSKLSSKPDLAVGTKINDALDKSTGMFTSGVPLASIVLLSDGTDVGSTVPRAKILGELRHGHVRVFSVGLVSHSFNASALQAFAEASNGAYVAAGTPRQLTPIFDSLGRRLSSEYLVQYRSRINPHTHVQVRIAVKGIPGAVTTAYTTPVFHVVPAAPYKPALSDRVIQSGWTMVVVALILAALFGWAVSRATRTRRDPLVERVAGFVSVQRQTRAERTPKTQEERITRSLLARVRPDTSRSRWSERLGATLELADLEIEPIQLVVLTAVGTVLVMVLCGVLLGPAGVVLGALTPLLVRGWILRRISRKRRAFAEQLPDNLDVLASALRAGHSLVGALAVVADDAIEPAKTEFRRVLAEEQFGVQLEDAFQVVVERMDNKDLDQVALVARLQREVGSNSAEVLDRVVETVRGRMELRRLIMTLTAQGRFSRWVLTLLPIALAVFMSLIGGNYMKPLFHSPLGQFLLVVAAIMVATGSWVIKKIVDIRV